MKGVLWIVLMKGVLWIVLMKGQYSSN